jgi:hypothetical protein
LSTFLLANMSIASSTYQTAHSRLFIVFIAFQPFFNDYLNIYYYCYSPNDYIR